MTMLIFSIANSMLRCKRSDHRLIHVHARMRLRTHIVGFYGLFTNLLIFISL